MPEHSALPIAQMTDPELLAELTIYQNDIAYCLAQIAIHESEIQTLEERLRHSRTSLVPIVEEIYRRNPD